MEKDEVQSGGEGENPEDSRIFAVLDGDIKHKSWASWASHGE